MATLFSLISLLGGSSFRAVARGRRKNSNKAAPRRGGLHIPPLVYVIGVALWAVATIARSPQRAPGAVRDAGPENMMSPPTHWDDVDQRSDESFPASDPPGLR